MSPSLLTSCLLCLAIVNWLNRVAYLDIEICSCFDMAEYCYESLEQGRSFSLVVDGLIATSAYYLEDLHNITIGSIDRRSSRTILSIAVVKLFCVSRYIAHTCRGRLKLARRARGRESLVTTTRAHLTASHIGALKFSLFKKVLPRVEPLTGKPWFLPYVMKRQWNDYDYDH